MTENDVTDTKYRGMICQFGSLFDGENLLRLKFLLYESLPISVLDKKDITGVALIDKLDQSGKIKYNDVSLLTEIGDLIEVEDVKKLISEYSIKVRQVNRPMNACHLSPIRKALFKTLLACTDADIECLAVMYKLTSGRFTKRWGLFFYLETHIWPNKPMQTNLKELHASVNAKAKVFLVGVLDGPVADDVGDGRIQGADNAASSSDENINSMQNNPNGSGDVRNWPWNYFSVRCRYVTMNICLVVGTILFITFLVLAVTIEGVFEKIIFAVLAMVSVSPHIYKAQQKTREWYKNHKAKTTTLTQSSSEEYNHLSA
ncbi:uncharacterized protein LOC117122925 [Anneissia japonica]|uniref:uncharacterized protein LOC117122925 n=1 Tax=Anneissia japonica TaxID=1529436 RepID=UPI0014257986|nr:uncharacterized protein LOC117122925 [Anneissia japonica]XP_033124594.1 uncharacterized protein LOC117122925 [Anneissia japonica]